MDLDIFRSDPFYEASSGDALAFPVPEPDRPVVDRAALLRAHHTLMAGCAFVIAQAGQGGAIEGKDLVHARLTGNRLHELDRFLSVLIDEVALLRGKTSGDPQFAKMRNTPNKLRRLGPVLSLRGDVPQRLSAIGRICAYLRHCGKDVSRVAWTGDMAIARGDRDHAIDAFDHAGESRIEASTLVAIAGVYRMVGDALLAAVAIERP